MSSNNPNQHIDDQRPSPLEQGFIARVTALEAEREDLYAEVARLTAERDALMRGGVVLPGQTAELGDWGPIALEPCVSCPACAFTFAAVHTDGETQNYSCPACEAAALAEAAQREMRERLSPLLKALGDDLLTCVGREYVTTMHMHLIAMDEALRALPLATPTLDAVEEQAMRRGIEWAHRNPLENDRHGVESLVAYVARGSAMLAKRDKIKVVPFCLSCEKYKEKCDGC